MIKKIADFEEAVSCVDEFRSAIASNGYVLLRGLVKPITVANIRSYLEGVFDPELDLRRNPVVGKGCPDYQRLDLGVYGGVIRFCRTFFLFGWNKCDPEITGIFDNLTGLRNKLMGTADAFGEGKGEESGKVYNATRVIHFPVGGGFMQSHTDNIPSAVRQEISGKFLGNFVTLLVLSKRGIDFESGGGYVVLDGENIDWEEYACPGDIALYDQNSLHGVSGVDTDKPIDLQSLNGRLVALSTPYPIEGAKR